ncbi:hypothetical protein POJ06DRAFT_262767 [Lipomyces tetrasporus]|uniref:Integral membrane protein n=1 Tax=Lipomyces tetrasporus TaxID=54092 RepID=A0AAD7VQ56_9ASCO|nr:uncharacterized protein POJ06DRAFT_262767 [Lipomyces tetrasporus]KAJ8097209.1 hypothetical protein POJ06DRAFT_262767 [Lipomyces tetrasporus]
MPRSTGFHSGRHEPHHDHHALRLQQSHVHGPVRWLNPTRARFAYDAVGGSKQIADLEKPPSLDEEHAQSRLARRISFEWRSRNNRKGRSLLILHHPQKADELAARSVVPQPTASVRPVLRNLRLMFTYFPYWDISYLVAVLFTFGSVIWVINGFFAWLPLQVPASEFDNEGLVGGGVTAFIGATVFEVGSVLLVLEAVNVSREGCFGWAVEVALEGGEKSRELLAVTSKNDEQDHHFNRSSLLGRPSHSPTYKYNLEPSWQWFPSFKELQTHYLHELGFLASLSQLIGATIFWMSGFTALPGIINNLSQGLLDGVYWAPQIIGGTGFIVSSALFILETQKNWYTPAPRSLGWHVGLWNLMGSVGFTLCGTLGPAYGSSRAQYQASLATFWGSWAFLIGSAIQWYESLDKWVITEVRDE